MVIAEYFIEIPDQERQTEYITDGVNKQFEWVEQGAFADR